MTHTVMDMSRVRKMTKNGYFWNEKPLFSIKNGDFSTKSNLSNHELVQNAIFRSKRTIFIRKLAFFISKIIIFGYFSNPGAIPKAFWSSYSTPCMYLPSIFTSWTSCLSLSSYPPTRWRRRGPPTQSWLGPIRGWARISSASWPISRIFRPATWLTPTVKVQKLVKNGNFVIQNSYFAPKMAVELPKMTILTLNWSKMSFLG